MAGPITWRNVNNTVGGGAGGLLVAGQQQVQQGIQALQNLVRANVEQNKVNQSAIRDSNTQDYLDQVAATDLATLATPEGQAALQQARAGMGGLIDRAATRDAIQSRLAAGQKAAVQQGQFDDFTTERDQRALVDNLRGLAAAGNQAEVAQILDANQFLNEGALRSELAGVQDNLRQRELRESAEGRAQRGEARSAASHALSMASGQENLNYSRAMHKEGLRKLSEQNTGDALAQQAFAEQQNALQAQRSLIADVAQANNVDMLPDGTINMSNLSEEQQDRIAKQLRDAGAGNMTETASRQRLTDQLRQAGVSVEGQKAALERYDLARTMNDLAPEDQALAQREAAQATAPMKATQQRLTDEYNRKSQNNPFTAPPQDVNAEAIKLVDGAAKRTDGEWLSTDVNQRSLMDATAKAMQEGIAVTLDGEDMTLVVPPSLAERAIREVGAQVFAAEGPKVRKVIEKLLKENPGLQKQAKEAQTMQRTYQNDMSKLNTNIIKAENSVMRARKAEKGVTVSSNDWVDAVLRRKQ